MSEKEWEADYNRLSAALTESRARCERLEAALRGISTYEKEPPEIMKDAFAYDRLLTFIQRWAASALEVRSTAGPAKTEGGER